MTTLARILAIIMKEAVQMRRDRMTFGMMLVLPVMQLILFGYAINTDPHSLPTAIQMEEDTPITRSIISGLEVSGYYAIVERTQSDMESDSMLARGDVSFVVTIPKGFTKRLLRGETPQLLIEADASDPSASSNAISRAQVIVQRALAHELYKLNGDPQTAPPLFELVIHPKYNPAAVTQYNIVPGLLGVILTMTMVMMTSLAMTRETEQGTMENLLAMPARPIEVMLGKISPYVIVGAVQTLVVLAAAIWVFKVPFLGSFWVLSLGVVIFVIANLAVGFSFSTFARSQMQAMQMTFFFFLPSLLLSGFMFPFRGMPNWAQMIGEILPLTHFLRIVRGTMLKGADLHQLQPDINAMLLFTLFMGAVAMVRYRQTLD